MYTQYTLYIQYTHYTLYIQYIQYIHYIRTYVHVQVDLLTQTIYASRVAGYKSESEKLIEGPPLFVIKIDKRRTLGDLKRILAEKVNMDPLYFKVSRTGC